MPDRKRRLRILLLHAVLLPTLLYVYTFFTLAPLPRTGAGILPADPAGSEQKRQEPSWMATINEGGLLFAVLIGGMAAGFAAGWYWHRPAKGNRKPQD